MEEIRQTGCSAFFDCRFMQKLLAKDILAQVFLGLTVCTEWVTIPAYISRFARDKIPVFTFIIGWAYTFAMPLGGFIKDTLGMDFLFYLALITSVITLFIIGLLWKVAPTQEEITENRLTSQSIISLYKESFETLRNPNIMRASLYSFLMFLNLNIALSLFPLRLSRLGFTAALIGLLQFARAGTNSSIRIFYDYIEKRIDRSNVLRIGAAVSGLALLFISVVESLPLLVCFWQNKNTQNGN